MSSSNSSRAVACWHDGGRRLGGVSSVYAVAVGDPTLLDRSAVVITRRPV